MIGKRVELFNLCNSTLRPWARGHRCPIPPAPPFFTLIRISFSHISLVFISPLVSICSFCEWVPIPFEISCLLFTPQIHFFFHSWEVFLFSQIFFKDTSGILSGWQCLRFNLTHRFKCFPQNMQMLPHFQLPPSTLTGRRFSKSLECLMNHVTTIAN